MVYTFELWNKFTANVADVEVIGLFTIRCKVRHFIDVSGLVGKTL
jgi:hypothetical protein